MRRGGTVQAFWLLHVVQFLTWHQNRNGLTARPILPGGADRYFSRGWHAIPGSATIVSAGTRAFLRFIRPGVHRPVCRAGGRRYVRRSATVGPQSGALISINAPDCSPALLAGWCSASWASVAGMPTPVCRPGVDGPAATAREDRPDRRRWTWPGAGLALAANRLTQGEGERKFLVRAAAWQQSRAASSWPPAHAWRDSAAGDPHHALVYPTTARMTGARPDGRGVASSRRSSQ